LGITERFNDSTRLIYDALGIAPADKVRSSNVTDHYASADTRFRRVEPVQSTPRLEDAMKDLIVFDEALYSFAVSEFDRRLLSKIKNVVA
jgi:hypothetical protein